MNTRGSLNARNSRYYERLEQSIVDYARRHNVTYTEAEDRIRELSPLSVEAMHKYFAEKHAKEQP